MAALLLTADLMAASKVAGASARSGVSVTIASSPADFLAKAAAATFALMILDLTVAGVDLADFVPRLKSLTPTPIVLAYGPHVHEARLAAATQAGCDEVISRGQFHAQMDEILRRFA